MHKSTLLFGVTTVLLLVVAIWHVLELQAVPPAAPAAANVPFGLPPASSSSPRNGLQSTSAALWDTHERRLVYEHNAFERRSIASLTKLMTAMIALDEGMPWEKSVTILPDEYGAGGNLLLHPGETVTMRDLFYASLLGSANNATKVYVRELDLNRDEFVERMNRKAIELGLEQTQFADVTGLDGDNISTAYEVALLADVAFREYPDIAHASRKQEYSFTVGGSGRVHAIRNTNKLVSEEGEVVHGSKTGYLDEAGYCVAIEGSGKTAHQLIVVLGSPSEQINLAEAKSLLYLSED
jgi:D-alanyl-D-alanine endopeptidase (penicillin-binding protein 7)